MTRESHDEEFQLSDRHDSDRMNFMFSPFPADRSINPKHWDSKMSYWRKEIKRCCFHFSDFSVSLEDLRRRFEIEKGRLPRGLDIVIHDMLRSGDLLPESYFRDPFDETWGKWSVRMVQASASWLWGKLWSGSAVPDQTRFVVSEVLQKLTMEFLDRHYSSIKSDKTDHVVPWNVAKLYKVNGNLLSDDQLILVVSFLKSKGKVRIGTLENGEKVIKFQLRTQNPVEPVNSIDLDIIRLKKAIAKLTIECKQLEDEGLRFKKFAQSHVRSSNYNQAKKILFQRRKVLKAWSRKQDALQAMKENLHVIQEAETAKMITEALNSSAILLTYSYKKQGLTVDDVEKVMDKVSEANQIVNDVEEALASGIVGLDCDYDVDDLERELEDLMLETANSNLSPASPALNLPDVPIEPPRTVVAVTEERKKAVKQLMPTVG